MYGAFQVFGEPIGFDFYAQSDAGVIEMGMEVSVEDSPVIHVQAPQMWGMNYFDVESPHYKLRLIKAGEDGGDLLLCFPRPEDDLREATAQSPMMVEFGKAQFLVGKVHQLGKGVFEAHAPRFHPR